MLTEIDLTVAADKLCDRTSAITDDKKVVIETADCLRQAYNFGLLAALDIIANGIVGDELKKMLEDAVVPG